MIISPAPGTDAVGQTRNEKPRRARTRRGVFVHHSRIPGLLVTGPAEGRITDDDPNGIGIQRRRLPLS